MSETHYLVRVYPDGSAKHSIRDAEGTAAWLEHNRTSRIGNALFVDGVCDRQKDDGYLSEAEIDFVEAAIREELAKGIHDLSKPEKVARHRERIAGQWDTWVGYGPEQDREHFKWPGAEPVYPARTSR